MTIGGLADQIRRAFPDVQGIDTFRTSGPLAAPLDAGPGTAVGAPLAPALMTDSYFTALADDHLLGVIFYLGQTCRGQNCEDQRYWYFETDDTCAPRWVGDYHQTQRDTCYDASGDALWDIPAALDPRQRCDADWSPRPIAGQRTATSLGIGADTCGGTAGPPQMGVQLQLSQSPDLGSATAVLRDTGIPALDGRAFTGTVKRKRLEIQTTEDLPGACPASRSFKITVDFEGSNNFPIPGAFAGIDIVDTRASGCTRADATCATFLFLLTPN
jgi:hypothetical protein